MSKIYIVQGSCGDYSDYNEWMVMAYSNIHDAQKHANFANEMNNQLNEQERAMYESPEFKAISARVDEMSPPGEYDWSQRDAWYKDAEHPERMEANDAYGKYWDDWHMLRGSNEEMNRFDPTYARRSEWQNWPTSYTVVDVEYNP